MSAVDPRRRALLIAAGLAPLTPLLGCRAPTLAVYNWGDYLAKDVVDRFIARETAEGRALRVTQDFYLSEAELLAKLRAKTTHDVVVPIDYLMARMLKEGLLRPLDLTALPGVAHLDPAYPPWRPDEKLRAEYGDAAYGVPYFWGVTGIGYDSERVDPPPTSWRALFDPRYAGRISVLDSKGDVFDQAQLAAGLGVNCKDKKALREVVFPMLLAQKKLLRAYDPHPERALASGETWIAQVDGGDLLRAQETRKSLRFVLPEEGAPYWVDYLSIPANAESPDTALRFLEFLLDPEIAAINANALHFATPNKTALDRGLVRDAGIAEIYARERGGPPLPRSLNWAGSVKELVDALWLELRGA